MPEPLVDLRADQFAAKEAARCFAKRMVVPRAAAADRANTWPEDLWEEARGLGLIGDCRLRLPPAMGRLETRPSLAGLGRARSLLGRAEPVDAADAVEFGLAEAITKDGEAVEELAADLLTPAPMWINGGTRRDALRMIDNDFEDASSRHAMRIGSGAVRDRLRSLATWPRPA